MTLAQDGIVAGDLLIEPIYDLLDACGRVADDLEPKSLAVTTIRGEVSVGAS